MNQRLPATQSTALPTLITRLAGRFELTNVDPQELAATLKATAFKAPNGQEVSDAQMTALLIVANQYGLNPWTKEIYAFPAKGGGIVPIVGVDGWLNIINSHPQFDGMEFEYDFKSENKQDWSCTCVIYRKDRSKPTRVTEFYEESYRSTEPWNQMGRRMLRNESIAQGARLAFGYSGIHDPEEGADIVKNMGMAEEVDPRTGEPILRAQQQGAAGATAATQAQGQGQQGQQGQGSGGGLPKIGDEDFKAKLPTWRGMIASGQKTPDRMVSFLRTKYLLTAEQERAIRRKDDAPADVTDVEPKTAAGQAPIAPTYAEVIDKMNTAAKAKDRDAFDLAATLIAAIVDQQQRVEATQHYEALLEEFV